MMMVDVDDDDDEGGTGFALARKSWRSCFVASFTQMAFVVAILYVASTCPQAQCGQLEHTVEDGQRHQ